MNSVARIQQNAIKIHSFLPKKYFHADWSYRLIYSGVYFLLWGWCRYSDTVCSGLDAQLQWQLGVASFNSLYPGIWGDNFKSVIFKHMFMMLWIMLIFCEIVLGWIPQNTFGDELALVQLQWLGAIRQQAFTWASVDPDLRGHYGFTRPQ